MMAPRPDRDRWLWVDPLANNARLRSGAVLLAEDIKRYILDHNVLVNAKDYEDGSAYGARLKGASYAMTPHPSSASMFASNDGRTAEVHLEQKEDSVGPYYVVPRHTLVYIKLRQELRIPFYCIGRHNLKISYVYQGLLLGTGPQVDPGYIGNLIIPLHNLTTRDVKLYINDTFVSIDFVRTTPLAFAYGAPATLKRFYDQYAQAKCLLDPFKVTKRRDLADYLPGLTPQSAMGEVLMKYEKTVDDLRKIETAVGNSRKVLEEEGKQLRTEQQSLRMGVEEELKGTARWQKIEALAVAALLVTMAIAVISWVRDYAFDTKDMVIDIVDRVEKAKPQREAGVDARITELEKRVTDLSSRLAEAESRSQRSTPGQQPRRER